MAGVGSKITASDYNSIQQAMAYIMGDGSLLYGYGQQNTLLSSTVAPNAKISVTQWNNLRTDILRCRQHQTGTDLSSQLAEASTTRTITETDRAAFETMIATAGQDANRLIAPPYNGGLNATRENLVTPRVRNTAWNGTLSQQVTVNFGSATLARYYFNTGSRFEISGSRVGGVGGAKDVAWTTILQNMGVVYFTRTDTVCTGTGNNSTIGWEDLTSTNQIIFSKDTENSTYAPNQYRIYARKPDAQTLVFTIEFADQSGGNPPNPGNVPSYKIDEDVTGTLTSVVQVYRASGDNVSVALPSATSTDI